MKYKAKFATSLFSCLILAHFTQYLPLEAENTQHSCAFPTLLGTAAARLGSVGALLSQLVPGAAVHRGRQFGREPAAGRHSRAAAMVRLNEGTAVCLLPGVPKLCRYACMCASSLCI